MKNLKFISFLFILLLVVVGLQESFSQSLRGLVNKGVENYDKGNFSDAEVNFKKGVEKTPESFVAKFNLGDAYFKQERFDDAIYHIIQHWHLQKMIWRKAKGTLQYRQLSSKSTKNRRKYRRV